MNILAIIPARGGSVGIKKKNIIEMSGHPMIAYSIKHALASKLINKVVVSSDNAEIIEVAKKYGAEVPFVRPAELAEGHVLDLPVFVHTLEWLKEHQNYKADIIVHLRPTAPYRQPEWIDEAITMLINHPEADSVRSVSAPEKHPYRMFTLDKDGYLESIMKHEHPEPYLLRRQDHPPVYHYNCVIDITKPKTIFEQASTTGKNMLPYIMNQKDVIDIDTPEDLTIAKILFKDRL